MLAPAFLPVRVEACLPRIAATVAARVDAWAAAGKVPAWDREVKDLALQLMVEVIAGFELTETQLRELCADCAAITAGLTFPVPLELFGLTPFGKAMKARRRVEALLMAQVDRCRSAAGGGGGPPSLLQDMVAARDPLGQPLSDRALKDNFVGLLVAGHDTTASSLGAALFHLAQAPDALAALRAEQDAVRADLGPELTPAALARMPFAEAVLREAWRLHPVVPVLGREANRDVALGGEFGLKAGQRAFVALHTVTGACGGAWAGEPEGSSLHLASFAPERWLAGSAEGAAAAAAQMPFGAGKRSCLGASLAWVEAKAVLALVARRLAFEVDAKAAKWTSFPFPTVAMDAVCAARRV